MAETDLTQSQADALSGTTDSDTDLSYPAIGESTYYTTVYRLVHRLLTMAKAAGNSLRVYKDGDLSFGVRAGRFMDGDTVRDYPGAAAQSLTNNQTNYIYLTAEATLTVNTSGFPDPSATPHIPLATIVTSSGNYNYTNIADCRPQALFGILDGIGPAARQDLMPNLNITAGGESADKRTITLQARDAGNNDLSQRVLVRVWIAATDYGAPSAAGNTVAVETGTQIEQVVANADYAIESDADGTVEIGITISGAASRYIMAEMDGRVYSSGEVTWAA
jgi:hypothetical protein